MLILTLKIKLFICENEGILIDESYFHMNEDVNQQN